MIVLLSIIAVFVELIYRKLAGDVTEDGSSGIYYYIVMALMWLVISMEVMMTVICSVTFWQVRSYFNHC